MKLVRAAEMRALEAATFATGVSAPQLMENAGRAVAHAMRERLGQVAGLRIVILAGPGNNGGDGLVAARYLHDLDAEVALFLLSERDQSDANLPQLRARDLDLPVLHSEGQLAEFEATVRRSDAVLDAVLGIGRRRALDGIPAAAIDRLNAASRGLVFALDVPSGLDPDDGAVDPHTVRASVTLTLGVSKLGLHLHPGASYAGEVQVLDIGLPPGLVARVETELLDRDWAQSRLPARPFDANKGSFGRVMVVAGSERYTGAAALACLAALRAGAGLVTLASVPQVRAAVAALAPEVTHLPLPERDGGLAAEAASLIVAALPQHRALLIGPGLGTSVATQAVVRSIVAEETAAALPMVLDADALNILARSGDWPARLKSRVVLTPHPGELSRLSGESVAELQADRLSAARRLATAWRQVLVLKGANTIIADGSGGAVVSPFANPLLASAGTGDVLAGVIAGLLAQGLSPGDAAGLAVYLHGASAETYRARYGDAGLLASELLPAVATVAADLRHGG